MYFNYKTGQVRNKGPFHLKAWFSNQSCYIFMFHVMLILLHHFTASPQVL